MKVKRNKLDILFSQLVRERAGWCCQKCGKYHPEGARMSLHCSHFHSRRKRSVRWHPQNAFAHCFSCHQYLGENPAVFTRWAMTTLSPADYELLLIRSGEISKFSKRDLAELYDEMKAAHAFMLAERKRGVVGRIEFTLFGNEVAA